MNEHYASLILEQPNGYAASLAYGIPERYLNQPFSEILDYVYVHIFFEVNSHQMLFYKRGTMKEAVDGIEIPADRIPEEETIFVDEPKRAKQKCLELVLQEPRIAQNTVHWVWERAKGSWTKV